MGGLGIGKLSAIQSTLFIMDTFETKIGNMVFGQRLMGCSIGKGSRTQAKGSIATPPWMGC